VERLVKGAFCLVDGMVPGVRTTVVKLEASGCWLVVEA
jgi:hypothetical protein